MTKFANAVWKLFESSTSAGEAVDLLNVPKRMGTIVRNGKGMTVIQAVRNLVDMIHGTCMTYILTCDKPPN